MMGSALWDERPGIVAPIGTGFPNSCRAALDESMDTRGLKPVALPQMHTTQTLRPDGRRSERYHVTETRPFIEGLEPGDLPPGYDPRAAFYLLLGFEGARNWRKTVQGFFLWEPLQQVMVPGAREAFRQVLAGRTIDLVSPNLAEAQAVYGTLPAETLVDAILDDGARAVALRMGPQGSIVGERGAPHVRVPAAPFSSVVDQTGAGNTYCGGLLSGIAQGLSLVEAAARGSVAASFCIEGWGVLRAAAIERAERDRRLAAVLGGANLGS